MKLKLKIISLMFLGMVFVLSPIIKGNFNFTTGISDKSSEYGDEVTLFFKLTLNGRSII